MGIASKTAACLAVVLAALGVHALRSADERADRAHLDRRDTAEEAGAPEVGVAALAPPSGEPGTREPMARGSAGGLILASRAGVPTGGTATLVHRSGRYVRGDFEADGSLGVLEQAFRRLLAAGACDLIVESPGCATRRLPVGGDGPGPPFSVALEAGTDLAVRVLGSDARPLETDLALLAHGGPESPGDLWEAVVLASQLAPGAGTLPASPFGGRTFMPTSAAGPVTVRGLPRGQVEAVAPSMTLEYHSAHGELEEAQQAMTVQVIDSRVVRVLVVAERSAPVEGVEVRLCTGRSAGAGGDASATRGFAPVGFEQVAKGRTDGDGVAEFEGVRGAAGSEVFAIVSSGNDWYRSQAVPLWSVTQLEVVASPATSPRFARVTDDAGRPVAPGHLTFRPADARTDLQVQVGVGKDRDPLRLPLAVRYEGGELLVQGSTVHGEHPALAPNVAATLAAPATEVHLEFRTLPQGAGWGQLIVRVPNLPDGDVIEVTVWGHGERRTQRITVADGEAALKGDLRAREHSVAVRHDELGQWTGSVSIPNEASAEVSPWFKTGG